MPQMMIGMAKAAEILGVVTPVAKTVLRKHGVDLVKVNQNTLLVDENAVRALVNSGAMRPRGRPRKVKKEV